MSQNDQSKTPTSTNIKIAAKDASQRASGAADPGPGDVSAAPSEAPQLVDIPDPPTPSQLVVKSTSSHSKQHGSRSGSASPVASMNATTSHRGSSATGSNGHKVSAHSGSAHSGNAHSSAGASGNASHSGPKSVIMASMKHSVTGASQMGPAASNQTDGAPKEPTSSRPLSGPSEPKSTGSSSGGYKSTSSARAAPKSASSQASAGGPGLSAAAAGPSSEPGAVHDVDEEGEGEVTQPDDGTASPSSPAAGLRGSSAISKPSAASPDAASGPLSVSGKPSAVSSPKPSSPTGSSASSDYKSHRGGKNKKKVTRFRYHKRVTVRTTGKTSPSTIMSKVNKKDHKAGITPSTIEDMDPQELMKRAGIKGSQQAHWRIRLRQTKRLTKNGQTTTQTKVAYRDSDGNKRVKTSSSPFCKRCGKKLEECKCDSTSQS